MQNKDTPPHGKRKDRPEMKEAENKNAKQQKKPVNRGKQGFLKS